MQLLIEHNNSFQIFIKFEILKFLSTFFKHQKALNKSPPYLNVIEFIIIYNNFAMKLKNFYFTETDTRVKEREIKVNNLYLKAVITLQNIILILLPNYEIKQKKIWKGKKIS